MKVTLCNKNILTKVMLPKKIDGSFWIVDEFTNNNIINIEAENGKWVMHQNEDSKIIKDNSYVTSTVLGVNTFYFLEYNEKKLFLYVENDYDSSLAFYGLKDNKKVSVGCTEGHDIMYNSLIFDDIFTLNNLGQYWTININQSSLVYLNGYLLNINGKKLQFGDTIFCYGLRLTVYYNCISINNPLHQLKLSSSTFSVYDLKKDTFNGNTQIIDSDSIKEIDFYKDDDYFFKKARVRRFIEKYELTVTPPPNNPEKEDAPLILTLGPMLTMAMISGMTLANAISAIIGKEKTIEESLPTLIMGVAMLMTSLLWPNLTRSYQKKVDERNEHKRQIKYKAYISRKKREILDVTSVQSQILKENLITLETCESIILNKKINLWERRNDQKDFLTVRVGTGKEPIDMSINYTKVDFSLEEDNLRKLIDEEIDDAKMLYNVPISYSFLNKKVTALMGTSPDVFTFVDNVLLQLLAFHSYDDLKIVFLVSKKNLDVWKKYDQIPHCFSNDKKVRFFATDIEEAKYVSSYLECEFINRMAEIKEKSEETETKEKTFNPYYLIITDDYPMIRNLGIVMSIMKFKEECGFSFLCIENSLRKLPSDCYNFLCLDKHNSTILCTDIDNYRQQTFNNEINYNLHIEECCKTIANVPIEFVYNLRSLPQGLGFMEMYNVGKVEQLNLFNRWRINNPVKSLRAPIGINDEKNLIFLDLHEKAHGPHGLIAGMTGSGKSEFIITYILSMAINYSPEEVSFILIDYKGGGLAGAFANKTLGIKLPHLSGTITNLDKSELNRTLVSIKSELQRRQIKFNEVRDKLGESTIDIYKYQKLYRDKIISDPMPHLFIISDEFAELKSQQPDFMDDLISTARIGRSLGVHLVLATQKPSGVVNDQIWANSKFKVCLKVQDRADSNEMLKLPDAAEITNPGRFYLQVGNNEIFVLGQSGWAGTQYVASTTVKKKYDRSISFIDNVGNVIKNVEKINSIKSNNDNSSDELSNILKYICKLSEQEKLITRSLWLDSIPQNIYIDDLIKKYSFDPNNGIRAILGEYDAPSKQYQLLLTMDLTDNGNSIVYGISGSNREMFIMSLIYSLCINYTADNINIYIIDYGSEALRMYGYFPQVGDIIYSPEDDKLTKLLIIINDLINERKKLFADYNGDYNTYCKSSGRTVPLKIIVLNNIDSFFEVHASLDETIIKLSREGERYGIVFIISAANPRSVTTKLERNFHNKYVLDVSDRGDYMEILGKIGNVYPAGFDGRGLIKLDEIYEFQTAQITNSDNVLDFIKLKVEEARKACSTIAPNVPSIPEEITLDMLDSYIKDINKLPVGIIKNSLKPCYYNFFKDKINLITSKNIKNCIDLLRTIIYDVRKLNQMTVLIDTEQELVSIGGIVNTYVDKNFEEFILQFEEFLDREIDGKNIKVLCIISGLEKFQESMNSKKFLGFFNGIKTLNNLNLIFVDSSYKLKKIGFESWYLSGVNSVNGIWVGQGFSEQAVITSSDDNAHRLKLNNQFGWVSQNGECKLVKLVGKEVNEDE